MKPGAGVDRMISEFIGNQLDLMLWVAMGITEHGSGPSCCIKGGELLASFRIRAVFVGGHLCVRCDFTACGLTRPFVVHTNVLLQLSPVISGSLSPRHGASSGCGWRNGLQMWRVSANILNKLSRTADKGWFSSLGVGQPCFGPNTKASEPDRFFGRSLVNAVMDLRVP
jgi:hypothetical protein